LTADPIGLEGGINLYQYVFANPINMVDPEGLDGGVISIPTIIVTTLFGMGAAY